MHKKFVYPVVETIDVPILTPEMEEGRRKYLLRLLEEQDRETKRGN